MLQARVRLLVVADSPRRKLRTGVLEEVAVCPGVERHLIRYQVVEEADVFQPYFKSNSLVHPRRAAIISIWARQDIQLKRLQ